MTFPCQRFAEYILVLQHQVHNIRYNFSCSPIKKEESVHIVHINSKYNLFTEPPEKICQDVLKLRLHVFC